jgi:ATP-binding cassette subfamily C protein
MRLLLTFARDYPWQTATMLLALLFAGIAEGISLTALLPLLTTALGKQGTESTAGEDEISVIVTNALATVGISPTIGALLAVFLAGITIKSLLVMFAHKRVGYAVAHVVTSLRLGLLRAMLRTRWEYFLDQRIGRLANAMTSEAIRAGEAFNHGIILISLCIHSCIYTGVALLVSWRATLTCLAAATVLLLISHFLVKMSRKAGKRQTKLLRSLLVRLTDTLQSVKPLKAMAREDLADAVLTAETEQVNQSLRKEVFSKEMLKAVQEPMFAAVIAVGIYLSVAYLGFGIAKVMVLVFLLLRVLTHLGKVQREYQKTVAYESAFWALQDTIKIAEEAREPMRGTLTPVLEHAIRFERIGFRYDEKQILRELSLTIPVGMLTTLVGPSGTGKTTIVDLVTGLLQPQEGRVLVDDQSLASLDLRQWRRMIGYVPQETLLLHDTVMNNVTLSDPTLGEADAQYALKGAGAWDFVAALPNSLHEMVGERGTKLSGGQRQRIMIARALVHRPRLLIMDEATSALDPDSEAAICRTLASLRGELTILAISHQRALVDAADRVYRLGDGGATLVTEREAALKAV